MGKNKTKVFYDINIYVKGKELDAVLKDIEQLTALPNSYKERSIVAYCDNTYKTRSSVKYRIVDGNNLIGIPGRKGSCDPWEMREFRVKEGELVEISEKD